MGSAILLLRQRGRGHADAVRRADGRGMASVSTPRTVKTSRFVAKHFIFYFFPPQTGCYKTQ